MAKTPKNDDGVGPGDLICLVDGSTFIFRAFHALPPLTRKSDGLPVGAVAGFCNMIWKLMQEGATPEKGDEPTHLAVIFDYSGKTFRTEIYDDYKAHRPDPPDDLVPQFGLIRQATRAFNLPCIEQEGWEADDIIATYATRARAAGAKVMIVAADKDMMQLVDPDVIMVDTMRNQFIDADFVREKFGVGPDKMIDLQALVGDSVDNVPGVPGIGPKTAAQLLDEYGDLEGVLSHAPEIKQNKRRENLIEFADQARLSQKLVTLARNVPLELPLSALAVTEVDGPTAVGFLKALEFTALTKRVADKTGAEIDAIEPAELTIEGWGGGTAPAHGPDMRSEPAKGRWPAPAAKSNGAEPGSRTTPADLVASRKAEKLPVDRDAYVTIGDLETLDQWVADATDLGRLAVKVEATGFDPMQAELCGIALALAPGRAGYVPLAHVGGDKDMFGGGDLVPGQVPLTEALERLKPLLEDRATLKLLHGTKFGLVLLARYGVALTTCDDTMLMAYALDAGVDSHGGYGLGDLSERWLDHTPVPLKEVAGSGKSAVGFDQVPLDDATRYAAESADMALRLWRVLKPRLAAERVATVYETLERPLVGVLARMERRGIQVDRAILARLSGAFAQSMARYEAEIEELAGEKFNFGSPKQLGDILFGKMQLPGGKKTKTGAWSTGADVLEELAAGGVELAARILDWRQLSKLKSTYTDALPNYIHPETGRVHTSYALASTTTGRLSSSEPNLQNIPVRTEEGRRIRTAFVAEKGTKLISADYSQIELRVLAHIADIANLKQAFADGLDIHAMTASEMFGLPVEGMDPMIRRRAKAINFGIIYGISAFGLANQLGIARGEAADYIKRYFERFPGIRDYMESTKAFCRANGYVETIFGRKAHYPRIKSSNPSERAFNERAAINAPIQGSAADIIRRAMIRIEAVLEAAKVEASMLLQVHDELVFEAPEGAVDAAIPLIRSVMEEATEPALRLSVPLQVDARAADDWEAAH